MSSSEFENLWKFMLNKEFEIDSNNSEDFLCVICHKLLIAPYTAECGCHYCMICIKKFLNDSKKHCPGSQNICRETILDFEVNVLRDFTTTFNVAKTVVKCPNRSCSIKLELRMIEDHLRTCVMKLTSCPYQMIGCSDERASLTAVDDHLRSDTFSHSELLIDAINNLRNDINVVRLAGDLINVKMEQQAGQIEDILETVVSIKKEITDIKEEGLKNESEMVCLRKVCSDRAVPLADVAATKEALGLLQLYDAKRVCDIGELRDEYTEMSRDLALLNARIGPEENGNDLKQEVKMCKKEVDELKMEAKKCKEEVEAVALRIKNLILDVKYDFVWTIEKFSKRRNWFQSDAFYKDNYKLCLRGWIGGLLGDYFKLYFSLLKGDRDGMAHWPMKESVTLVILDQVTNECHRSWRTSYDVSGSEKNKFDRPTGVMNDSLGGPWIYVKDVRATRGLLVHDSLKVCCVFNPP